MQVAPPSKLVARSSIQAPQFAPTCVSATLNHCPQALVHCWAGGSRTGVALAAQLVRKRGKSEDDAAAAVLANSTALGLNRRVDPAHLAKWAAP